MNVRAAAGLAACAAVLLSSCASTPRSAPLTIEIFDSRAAVPPAPPYAFILALPEVPVRDASALTPVAVEAGGASAESPAPLSSLLPLPGPPDFSASGFDESLAGPARPAATASFSLAVPAVPAAALAPAPARKPPLTAGTVPRPPRPKAGGAAAIASATGGTATGGTATGGTAAGAAIPILPGTMPEATQPAAAPAPSVGGSGGAAVPAPSPNTYGRLREIYARQGDTLQVGLDGVGFLFLGLPDAQSDGMAFKSKENRDNRTLFTFQALKLGTYDLDFLQQDNMAGKSSRETVRVHVVSDQDFNAAVSGEAAAPEAPAQDSGDPLFAQKLATVGSYQAAIAELLKGYRDGNPGLNDQIAALYMRMGSYDAAEKYYSKNLTPPSDFTTRAVIGLVKVAVAQDDQQALLSWLKQFLQASDPGVEEPLIQAVRMEKAHAEIGMALDLAGEYVKRYPAGAWRDEADFLTAQLLEADSQFRDIARARQLYSAILTDHPESPFAERARQRVLYIDRHFYQVR